MRKNRLAGGENWLCHGIIGIIEKGRVSDDPAFSVNIFCRGTFSKQCGTSG